MPCAMHGCKEHVPKVRGQITAQLFPDVAVSPIDPRLPRSLHVEPELCYRSLCPQVVAPWVSIAVVDQHVRFVLLQLFVDGNHRRVDAIVSVVYTAADCPGIRGLFHVEGGAYFWHVE